LSARFASVVLPVYNQADHIEAVLQNYVDELSKLHFEYELLPVVNGPRRDASLAVCNAMQSRYPVIRTLCIEEGGWGLAVQAGLAAARGDLLCYTNSARTSGKDLLLFLMYGSVHDDSVIKANRKIRENWRRRLGSLLYNLECRSVFDLAYWDINGTPKVFNRNLDRLLTLQSHDDLIDLEFNVICRQVDYPVLEVPLFSTSRLTGSTLRPIIRVFRLANSGSRPAI
jgi:glycosyltransferase involved in cell wall biosynthesis